MPSDKAPPRIPPFKTLEAFEQTARFGNIAKAAEHLNLTPSAVSHQIANLEGHVGRQLFHRTSKGLQLTPVGERYLRDIAGALQGLATATHRVASDAELECLRLHSAPSFGLLWLLPRLQQFRDTNPDMQINLSCSYESLHFTRDQIDVDIRHGFPNWMNLEIRTVRHESIAVLASPDLLKKAEIASPSDLLDKPLILSEAPLVQWPQWFAAQGLPWSDGSYSLSFDRSYMSLEAAAHGLGFALESTLLAHEYLKSGRLVAVFEGGLQNPVSAHHLVFPHSHADYPRVRRFLAWMQEELGHSFVY